MLLANSLEIGRVIISGESILLSTQLGDEIGESALGIFLGALEHQVFEKMRNARLADGIVRGPIFVHTM